MSDGELVCPTCDMWNCLHLSSALRSEAPAPPTGEGGNQEIAEKVVPDTLLQWVPAGFLTVVRGDVRRALDEKDAQIAKDEALLVRAAQVLSTWHQLRATHVDNGQTKGCSACETIDSIEERLK